MNHEPLPPADRPVASGINYLKLTLSLMAVVLFWHLIEHWADVKAGFRDGYRDTQQQTPR